MTLPAREERPPIVSCLCTDPVPEPRSAALRWLKAAIERGFVNYPFLARHDPFFKPLRDDARFRRLLELARQRWESFEE